MIDSYLERLLEPDLCDAEPLRERERLPDFLEPERLLERLPLPDLRDPEPLRDLDRLPDFLDPERLRERLLED